MTNMSTTFRPETKKELRDLINRLIEERGNKADLNDIINNNINIL